jgi:hypothetical protein
MTPGNVDHPLKQTYQQFMSTTPCVTRSLVVIALVSFFLSFLISKWEFALALIPLFTVPLELYRLITTILVNDFYSVVLAILSRNILSQFERSYGSSQLLLVSLGIFTVLTNLVILIASYGLYHHYESTSGDGASSFLVHHSSSGVGATVWGILSLWSSRERNATTNQRLLIWDVPSLYYPTILFVISSFLSGGIDVTHLFALILGYAIGRDHLRILLLTPSYVRQTDDIILASSNSGKMTQLLLGWIPNSGNHCDDGQEMISNWATSSLSHPTSIHRDTEITSRAAASGRTLGGGNSGLMTASATMTNTERDIARAARLHALEIAAASQQTAANNSEHQNRKEYNSESPPV